MKLIVTIFPPIILYMFYKNQNIAAQKIVLIMYSVGVVIFSMYARVDLDIIIAFIVLMNGAIFSVLISGLGVAEGVTGLSLVYVLYRIVGISHLEYTNLALWLYVTLVVMGEMFTLKNLNSIKLVKTLKNDITAKEYSSHKAVNMEVGDEAKVIEELRPLGKIQNDSEIVQAREITGKLVKTSTRVTVVGIMGNTALVTVKKDDGNSKEI